MSNWLIESIEQRLNTPGAGDRIALNRGLALHIVRGLQEGDAAKAEVQELKKRLDALPEPPDGPSN